MKIQMLSLLTVLLTGCAITRNVVPVDSTVAVKKVYVYDNQKVSRDDMTEQLVEQFRALGFESDQYAGDTPPGATHVFTYTATWTWDIATYLVYFRGTLYEHGRVIGEVEYDAKTGGSSLAKFGKTREKIEPLLAELMSRVRRDGRASVVIRREDAAWATPGS